MPQSPPKRPKRPAISQLPAAPLTRKQKLAHLFGWLLFMVAAAVCVLGLYGLFQVMSHARVATLDVLGTQTQQQRLQVSQQIQPVMVGNYFTSDLEQNS